MNIIPLGRKILEINRAWREECGVFGVWNHEEASHLTYLGLYAIQHRGQEATGIVSLNGKEHRHFRGLGLVADVFMPGVLEKLPGRAAIGHVRYSTSGGNKLSNAQPLTAQLISGPVALAHNGNIVNNQEIRTSLKRKGVIFHGSNDTEALLHMLARDPSDGIIESLKDNLKKLVGAFSMVVLTDDKLVAIRDRHGFRPLSIGKIKNKEGVESYVVSSETCSFDLIGAKHYRDVKAGEIFWVDESGEHSVMFGEEKKRLAQCVFEHVYFSRPDSQVFGRSVYETRKNFGRELAKESPVEADVVIPVPDSGVPAAIGYANEINLPFELGIIRNHYVGRTFIQPHQSIRSFGVKVKLNPQRAVLEGKRVIVIDDSVIRGTTSKKIVDLIRQAGAREVHLRIAAPSTRGSCYYGVDTPSQEELIASKMNLEEICNFIGADSMNYLSMEALWKSMDGDKTQFCAACFDRDYPTELFKVDPS